MLDKLFKNLFKALFDTILERFGQRSTARDGTPNQVVLDRAGKRISKWMRSVKDGVRSRGQSNEDGSKQ